VQLIEKTKLAAFSPFGHAGKKIPAFLQALSFQTSHWHTIPAKLHPFSTRNQILGKNPLNSCIIAGIYCQIAF
jgi:hypothetical protein